MHRPILVDTVRIPQPPNLLESRSPHLPLDRFVIEHRGRYFKDSRFEPSFCCEISNAQFFFSEPFARAVVRGLGVGAVYRLIVCDGQIKTALTRRSYPTPYRPVEG